MKTRDLDGAQLLSKAVTGVGECKPAIWRMANLQVETHRGREIAMEQWMASTRMDNAKDFKSLANTAPQQ